MSGLDQLRAAFRLVRRGYAARGRPPASAGAVPRRRQAAERTGIRAAPERLRRYLAATAGESLLAPVQGGTLPPLYCCTWETLLALELLSVLDPALPLGAMVHAGTELLIARPPRVDEPLLCRVELDRAEAVPDGLRIEVVGRNWDPGGQLRTETIHRFRLRTGPAGERRPPEPLDLAGWERVREWSLGAGAGRRYASVSGDWNPIHLFAWTARPLGFRHPILHGFCTAAMVAHAVCEHAWRGDPAAVRRMRIDFRAPLSLPGSAVLWLREAESGRAFRVTDPEATRLFAEGEIGGG